MQLVAVPHLLLPTYLDAAALSMSDSTRPHRPRLAAMASDELLLPWRRRRSSLKRDRLTTSRLVGCRVSTWGPEDRDGPWTAVSSERVSQIDHDRGRSLPSLWP